MRNMRSRLEAPTRGRSALQNLSVKTAAVGLAVGLFAAGGCDAPPQDASFEGERQQQAATEASTTGNKCFRVTDRINVLSDATNGPTTARRALAVTEKEILTPASPDASRSGFSFERVMTALVVPFVPKPGAKAKPAEIAAYKQALRQKALALFQQWWSTQATPACGSVQDRNGNTPGHVPGSSDPVKPYPYQCPRGEGAQATVDPFLDVVDGAPNPDFYIPVGLFNRLDLAPPDGAHCGEYRIVFAKRSGVAIPPGGGNNTNRNLIIFEGALPNPTPSAKLAGCFPYAAFWGALALPAFDSPALRGAALEKFYFDGTTARSAGDAKAKVAIGPVFNIGNFGAAGRGQIRTNQFTIIAGQPNVWNLREFITAVKCPNGTLQCPRIVPDTVKTNPFGVLFDPRATLPEIDGAPNPSFHGNAAGFQQWFVGALDGLLADRVVDLTFGDNAAFGHFNTAESLASASNDNRYLVQFSCAIGTGACPTDFRTAIANALALKQQSLPPDLRIDADQVVLRAQSQSCAGCHRLNDNVSLGPAGANLIWPRPIGFVHVTEQQMETTQGGEAFMISHALKEFFLPHRLQLMADFLIGNLGCPPQPGQVQKKTLSGATTH
jgi:hypothetical protein